MWRDHWIGRSRPSIPSTPECRSHDTLKKKQRKAPFIHSSGRPEVNIYCGPFAFFFFFVFSFFSFLSVNTPCASDEWIYLLLLGGMGLGEEARDNIKCGPLPYAYLKLLILPSRQNCICNRDSFLKPHTCSQIHWRFKSWLKKKVQKITLEYHFWWSWMLQRPVGSIGAPVQSKCSSHSLPLNGILI